MWASDQAGIQAAASEDAEALVAAESAARSAATEHAATVELVTAYLDADVRPTLSTVTAQVSDFGQEAADNLSEAVAALEAVLAPPAPTEGDVDTATTVVEQELIDIQLDVPADRELVASALEDEYRELSAEDRDAARAAAAAETRRLTAVAEEIRADGTTIRTAVEAVDSAIVDVASAAVTSGTATLDTLEYASDEARAALGAAIDALGALTDVELPVAWSDRAAGTPSPVADVIAAIGAYGSAAAEAHSSEVANTPSESWTDYIEYDPCLATLCSVDPFWPLF